MLNKFIKRKASKRRTYRKKYTKNTVAKQVKQILAKQVETKFNIVTQTEQAISTLTSPSTNYVLNQITTGNTLSTRVGQKISPKYIDIRGHVHTGEGAVAQYVKIMLVQCHYSDDGLVDLQEGNTATIAPAANDVSAIYNRINTTKYKVLSSRLLKIGPSGGNWFGTAFFNMNVKLSGVSHFEQGVNIPEKNKLMLIFIARRADNDEVMGTTTEITFNSKFYFQDM